MDISSLRRVQPYVAVHALLHNRPFAIVGHEETVQVEIVAVLNGRAVDFGDEAAHAGKPGAVETDVVRPAGAIPPESSANAALVSAGWRDVWLGAFLTASFFELGKTAIGFYIGKQGLASTYGAAASIIVVLIWVYYTSQII